MTKPFLFRAFTCAAVACFMASPALYAQAPPVAQDPPHAPHQKPVRDGQTRAPEQKLNVEYEVVTVAEGLERPWGIAFLPDKRMLVTERPGRMRIVDSEGSLSEPVSGLPAVDARVQGGLLDVSVDPQFSANQLVYWSYSEPGPEEMNNTAVARGRLVSGAAPRVENVEVIFRQQPRIKSTGHFGSSLIFAPDGTLFITLGDRQIPTTRFHAQRLDGTLGKVVRINPDGSIPEDNPFVGRPDARPEIWSYGHRNVQGGAIHPETHELWTMEHGTRGGDELNIARKGKDYGWPTIAYGLEYSTKPITGNITAQEGMEQPVYYWDPVIAPGGMIFYTGSLFPEWRNSLFIAALRGTHVARLTIADDRVVGEEQILLELKERIREVVQGPEGALYVATDNEKGRVLKIVPKTANSGS